MAAAMLRQRFKRTRRVRQRGSFLLESLIAVLLVAFGILGLLALMGRSMQNIDDAKFRGEAAWLANSYIGEMWTDTRTLANLQAGYSTTGGGGPYVEFKTLIAQRLPNVTTDPDVQITAGPTATSANVVIRVFWRPPGEPADHRFEAFATIGGN